MLRELACEKANRQKLNWDDDENVPQEVIRRYTDEIAMNYERASDRAPIDDLRINE